MNNYIIGCIIFTLSLPLQGINKEQLFNFSVNLRTLEEPMAKIQGSVQFLENITSFPFIQETKKDAIAILSKKEAENLKSTIDTNVQSEVQQTISNSLQTTITRYINTIKKTASSLSDNSLKETINSFAQDITSDLFNKQDISKLNDYNNKTENTINLVKGKKASGKEAILNTTIIKQLNLIKNAIDDISISPSKISAFKNSIQQVAEQRNAAISKNSKKQYQQTLGDLISQYVMQSYNTAIDEQNYQKIKHFASIAGLSIPSLDAIKQIREKNIKRLQQLSHIYKEKSGSLLQHPEYGNALATLTKEYATLKETTKKEIKSLPALYDIPNWHKIQDNWAQLNSYKELVSGKELQEKAREEEVGPIASAKNVLNLLLALYINPLENNAPASFNEINAKSAKKDALDRLDVLEWDDETAYKTYVPWVEKLTQQKSNANTPSIAALHRQIVGLSTGDDIDAINWKEAKFARLAQLNEYIINHFDINSRRYTSGNKQEFETLVKQIENGSLSMSAKDQLQPIYKDWKEVWNR